MAKTTAEIQSDKVTIREVYTLIDSVERNIVGLINGLETKTVSSINRLEVKFDTLESGRLTDLEKNMANMQGRMMMIPTIISIAVSVFFFIMNYVINRVP